MVRIVRKGGQHDTQEQHECQRRRRPPESILPTPDGATQECKGNESISKRLTRVGHVAQDEPTLTSDRNQQQTSDGPQLARRSFWFIDASPA